MNVVLGVALADMEKRHRQGVFNRLLTGNCSGGLSGRVAQGYRYGRGYGHGIGLCQEGAMRMTKLGYSYKDIIHFYYKDVHLVDQSALNYFKQE